MDLDLPPGFELEVGGESAKRDEAVGNLASLQRSSSLIRGVVLTFNSFRLATWSERSVSSPSASPPRGRNLRRALWLHDHRRRDGPHRNRHQRLDRVLAALEENEAAARGDVDAAVRVAPREPPRDLDLTHDDRGIPLIFAGGSSGRPSRSPSRAASGATLIAVTLVPAAHGAVARRRAAARAGPGNPHGSIGSLAPEGSGVPRVPSSRPRRVWAIRGDGGLKR